MATSLCNSFNATIINSELAKNLNFSKRDQCKMYGYEGENAIRNLAFIIFRGFDSFSLLNFGKMSEVTVAYWNIRGLGAPLRMMTMYANVPLNSVNYDLIPKADGGFDSSSWFDVKPELKKKNPLINLPYIIDGDHVITQSNACFLYLGRKFHMLGKNEVSLAKCEQLLMEIFDIRNGMTGFSYNSASTKQSAVDLFHRMTSKTGSFHKLELWLEHEVVVNGYSGAHLVDDCATAPDFHLYEMLSQYSALAKLYDISEGFSSFPYLSSFLDKFSSLPGNQRYLSSALAKIPINNKGAAFGATVEGGPWETGMTYEFAHTSGTY